MACGKSFRPTNSPLIVNTGDDLEWWGLYVSPDIDSIPYVLAGLLSKERGWGVKGDTFLCLQAMGNLASRSGSMSAIAILPSIFCARNCWRRERRLSEATQRSPRKLGVQATHPSHEQLAGGDES